ncbi:MAG: ion transporter [Xanthobacteraceae bacterium]
MVLVDFLAFAPELIFIMIGANPPTWMRSLRVFRLAKMVRYIPAVELVTRALRACIQELLVALSLSVVLWYLASVVLYLTESGSQPDQFGSITRTMWWSVVTLTTVGYGDVYPITVFGKIAAGLIAVLGVGTVALPSGIMAGAFIEEFRERRRQKNSAAESDNDSGVG